MSAGRIGTPQSRPSSSVRHNASVLNDSMSVFPLLWLEGKEELRRRRRTRPLLDSKQQIADSRPQAAGGVRNAHDRIRIRDDRDRQRHRGHHGQDQQQQHEREYKGVRQHSSTIAVMAQRALVLLLFVGSMWLVRAADTFRADGTSIAGVGVIPRSTAHPSGILTAPFIHANWPHLIANTVPLLVLGALVLIGGAGEFVFVTLICALVGGAGTWLFGESANHIGASGVIFGYV